MYPPKKKIKNIKIKIPYCKMKNLVFGSSGKNANKICEPSKGGIGNKLKIAKRRLIWTI